MLDNSDGGSSLTHAINTPVILKTLTT